MNKNKTLWDLLSNSYLLPAIALIFISVQSFRYFYTYSSIGEIVENKYTKQKYLLYYRKGVFKEVPLSRKEGVDLKNNQLVLVEFSYFMDDVQKVVDPIFIPKSVYKSKWLNKSFRDYPTRRELGIRRCDILFESMSDIWVKTANIVKVDTLDSGYKFVLNHLSYNPKYFYSFKVSKEEAEFLDYQIGSKVSIYIAKRDHLSYYIE